MHKSIDFFVRSLLIIFIEIEKFSFSLDLFLSVFFVLLQEPLTQSDAIKIHVFYWGTGFRPATEITTPRNIMVKMKINAADKYFIYGKSKRHKETNTFYPALASYIWSHSVALHYIKSKLLNVALVYPNSWHMVMAMAFIVKTINIKYS